MLYKRLTKDLFKDLSDAGIIYSLLEWSDTNETIVFIEKDNSIYSTIYSNDSDTFTDAFILVDGTSASPTRDGDYVVLEYIFNEKSQQVDVLYTDVVLGIKQQEVDLWDGLLPWETSSVDIDLDRGLYSPDGVKHSSGGDSLFTYSPLTRRPPPSGFVVEGIEFKWVATTTSLTAVDYGTSYKIYEEGILIGETDDLLLLYLDVKPDTEYTITGNYAVVFPPHEKLESIGVTINSGYQTTGIDYHPFVTSGIDSSVDYVRYNTRPVFLQPFPNDSVTNSFSSVDPININTTVTSTSSDFGLTAYNTRVEVISFFTELYTSEIESPSLVTSSDFGYLISNEDTELIIVNYYGNFIL